MNELIPGRVYTGTTTGKLRGERFYREGKFVAARASIEPFIRDRAETPDQDRVFMVTGHGATPGLYVAGSIKLAD